MVTDSRAWLATISSDRQPLEGRVKETSYYVDDANAISQSSNDLIYFRGYTTL